MSEVWQGVLIMASFMAAAGLLIAVVTVSEYVKQQQRDGVRRSKR